MFVFRRVQHPAIEVANFQLRKRFVETQRGRKFGWFAAPIGTKCFATILLDVKFQKG